MQGFIYIWENKKNGMKYIGSHYGEIDDGYISSGKYFLDEYNKDPSLFCRRILHSGLSRKQALEKEKQILTEIDAANNEMYYNLHNETGNGWAHHENPELREIYYQRISQSKKGKTPWNKGKNIWGDHNRHKLKIDKWLVRTPGGKEIVIENMLEYCRKHCLNPSAMSAVARGKRRQYKGYWCKKLTNTRNVDYEYKKWQSKGHSTKANYGIKNGSSVSIEVNGIHYDCMREASEKTGLSMYKLRKLKK